MSRSIAIAAAALLFTFAVAPAALAYDSGNYGSPPEAVAGDSGPLAKARSEIAAKEWTGAIATLFPLTKSDPKNADVENLLGYCYRMLGQYPQAFLYYDRALQLDPTHKGALEYEGEAYLETNQLAKAESNLARLKQACQQGCKELAQLEGAVDRYKAKTGMN